MTAAYGELAYGEESAPSVPSPLSQLKSAIRIEARVYTELQSSLQIEAQVTPPQVQSSLQLEARVYSQMQSSLQLEAQIFGAVSGIWSPVVYVDGVDRSAQITGQISITTEEGASAIAQVSISPAAGPVDVLSWLNKPITIDYQDGVWKTRRFTGVVSSPSYDPATALLTFDCTTDMQGKLEPMTRAQIAATIPGSLFSADVLDDNPDGWQHAQERLKTVPGSLWCDKSGAVRFSLWAAKTTPDIVLTPAQIIAGSMRVKWQDRRQLVNRILVQLDYRFKNLRQREHHFQLAHPNTFCTFIRRNYKLPEKSQIRAAAEGTGWSLLKIGYTELPESQTFDCPVPVGENPYILWHKSRYAATLALSANFTLAKRWAQTVTENYAFELRCEDSIDAVGEFAVQEAYGIESDYDATEWEQHEFAAATETASLHPGGSGDLSDEADPDKRLEMELAQRVIFAKAEREMRETHRGVEVEFTTPLIPDMNLSWTVETQGDISTRAKARRIHEVMSVRDGSALQTVALAVSRHEGAGTGSADPLDPVDRPEATPETPYKKTVRLGYRIGPARYTGSGSIGGDLGDDEFNGFSTNDKARLLDEDYWEFTDWYEYPEGLAVFTPEIEEPAVNSVVVQKTQTINIVVPEDPLTVTR